MKSRAPEPGFRSTAVKPFGEPLDYRRDRMLKMLDDDELDIRGWQLRLHVDRNPVVGRIIDDAHLVVRALPRAQADFDGLPLQHTVRA